MSAVRKGEHDLALGNVIGSNMFNTTIVIGITGIIAPTKLDPAILTRDIPVMIILTAALFIMAYNYRGNENGVINRFEGGLLLFGYVAYNIGLIYSVV
ncbi:MAG: cation:H+ antiporter [Candidatus Azotimanducaceae bacterium]